MVRNMKKYSLHECIMGLLFISFVVMRSCSNQGSSIEKAIGSMMLATLTCLIHNNGDSRNNAYFLLQTKESCSDWMLIMEVKLSVTVPAL